VGESGAQGVESGVKSKKVDKNLDKEDSAFAAGDNYVHG